MELQLDMFCSTESDYLYSQFQNLKYSIDKKFNALFALMTEDKKELMKMKKLLSKLTEEE